ncbi:unnamed protein product (mitochondrion) [Plasmodiophora brassicae]|uniref:Uncharacterized protein n=1 Tax=Plasmodiophora brassicae TaxID=37360 RepID=A0A0G4J1I3_PLABS|nr:hypothetical protein PBRA_002109 [Plasmodiophora brassicae]SPQ93218.1 unnamed protein product [Plasmodiophora brassicae]
MLVWSVVVAVGLASAACVEAIPDDAAIERDLSSALLRWFCDPCEDHETGAQCRLLVSQVGPALVPVTRATFGSEADTVLGCVSGQRPFMDMARINWTQVVADRDQVMISRLMPVVREISPAIPAILRTLNSASLARHIVTRAFIWIRQQVGLPGIANVLSDPRVWPEVATRLGVYLGAYVSQDVANAVQDLCQSTWGTWFRAAISMHDAMGPDVAASIERDAPAILLRLAADLRARGRVHTPTAPVAGEPDDFGPKVNRLIETLLEASTPVRVSVVGIADVLGSDSHLADLSGIASKGIIDRLDRAIEFVLALDSDKKLADAVGPAMGRAMEILQLAFRVTDDLQRWYARIVASEVTGTTPEHGLYDLWMEARAHAKLIQRVKAVAVALVGAGAFEMFRRFSLGRRRPPPPKPLRPSILRWVPAMAAATGAVVVAHRLRRAPSTDPLKSVGAGAPATPSSATSSSWIPMAMATAMAVAAACL